MFEQRQLWEIERNNAANENKIPVRSIGDMSYHDMW
jgi:hypothetical protein